MRYYRVEEEVRKLKANTVIEVGTWNGDRAIAMASVTSWPFFYYGFDLFEDMTREVSEKEYNVKRSFSESEVLEKLGGWKSKAKRTDVQFFLYKGHTRKTLPAFLLRAGRGMADMAWIDGGHSVATIGSDFTACRRLVKSGGTVLLDDFYSEVPEEMLQKVGCNSLIKYLKDELWDVNIFPDRDPVNDFSGKQIGWVQIAKVIV